MTDLSITQQLQENRLMRLSVTVPAERVDKAMRSTAQRLSKQLRIPGFRPGKVPYPILLQRLGREALLQETAEDMVQEIYKEALTATDIQPYDAGAVTDIQYDPLIYTLDVPLPPTAEAGDYRSLRIPYQEADMDEVAAQVQAEIAQIQEQNRTWTPIEGPVAYGDLVTAALKVRVNDEVVLDNDEWDFIPDTESYTMAPAFDAAFIGMNTGESKSFTADFPLDGQSAWKGQTGEFAVTVKGIKRREMPALDDEFAKAVSKFETYAEFYQDRLDHMAGHAREDADLVFERAVLDAGMNQATLAYPPAAIDRFVEMIADEQEALYKSYGFGSLEDVVKMQGLSLEDYRQNLREPAEKRLRQELFLDAVVTAEQISASDYEVDQDLVEAADGHTETVESYRKLLRESAGFAQLMQLRVLRGKARNLLKAIARGEEVPAPGQHPVAEAPIIETTTEADIAETTGVDTPPAEAPAADMPAAA